jgi:hypothetical protein
MKKLILMLFVSLLLIGCAPAAPADFTEEEFDKAVAAVKAEYGEDYIPSAEINLQHSGRSLQNQQRLDQKEFC